MPKLAQQAHEAAMESTVQQVLDQAGVVPADLSAVAVTVGPGLSLCLKVPTTSDTTQRRCSTPTHPGPAPAFCNCCLCFLAMPEMLRPIAPGGHHLSALQEEIKRCVAQVGVQKARQLAVQHGLRYVAVHHMEAHALVARAAAPVTFPFLCLLVSGGHNLLVIVHGVGSYSLLGSTLDDAVGMPWLNYSTMQAAEVIIQHFPSRFTLDM